MKEIEQNQVEWYYTIPEYDDTYFDFVITIIDDSDDIENIGKFTINDGYGSDYELEGYYDTKEDAIEVIKEFINDQLKHQKEDERDPKIISRIRKKINTKSFDCFEGKRGE